MTSFFRFESKRAMNKMTNLNSTCVVALKPGDKITK